MKLLNIIELNYQTVKGCRMVIPSAPLLPNLPGLKAKQSDTSVQVLNKIKKLRSRILSFSLSRAFSLKMWRGEGVRIRRCENEKMWRWEDVKMSRCEDEKMWRCKDVKMWRWEHVRIEDVMWRCENGWQTPTIRRTLRSNALGKKRLLRAQWKF